MFLITIRSVYSESHVDSLAYTESNVNKHKSKSAHWWSWSCDGQVSGRSFSQENTPEGPQKFPFSI